MVHIYFGTSTFDRVEKDVKVAIISLSYIGDPFDAQVTLWALLGLVGGTMGLFTGFSILSGIEIVYFASKFLYRSKVICRKNTEESDV